MQRSPPEQIMAHDAGTSRLCKECWDVCNNMLFEHAILGSDTISWVLNIGKRLALKHIRSDNHFITQAGIFLQ